MVLAFASLALLTFPSPDCSHLGVPSAPPATANDNRVPAGTLRDGVLTVRLVAQRATWYPEGEKGCGITLYAFAEEGKTAQIPGPLLRVTTGTEVRVTVRNALSVPVGVWGLRDPSRSARDTLTGVIVPADSAHSFAFRATVAGRTYRFRLVTISANTIYVVSMQRDSLAVPWRAVARDGADLPPAQAGETGAVSLGPGSTWDFEVTPSAPGTLRLLVEATVAGQRLGRPVAVTFRVRAP